MNEHRTDGTAVDFAPVEQPYEIQACLSDDTWAVIFDGVNIVAQDLTESEAKDEAAKRNKEFAESRQRKLNL